MTSHYETAGRAFQGHDRVLYTADISRQCAFGLGRPGSSLVKGAFLSSPRASCGWKLLSLFPERHEVVDDGRVRFVNRPDVPAFLAQVVIHDCAQPGKGHHSRHETTRRAGRYCNAQGSTSPHIP